MSSAIFDLGDTARTFVTFFKKPDKGKEQIADPTAVTCVIKDPQNVETIFTFGADPELIKTSIGRYKLERPCNIVGTWAARWKGIGSVAAVDEVKWVVRPSTFANT